LALVSSDRDRTAFLDAVPILAQLPDQLRSDIAARSNWVHVPAGRWLFRQGEVGDSLYVVRSGRLEVVVEGEEDTVVRVLARGAHVGELALLTGSPRSASVRATRDSELLRVARVQFAQLLREEPDFSLALTHELGRQLQLSRSIDPYDRPRPTTISVLAAEADGSLAKVGESLLSELRRSTDVGRLDRPAEVHQPSEYGDLLDKAEREHEQVLLIAGAGTVHDSWVDFCLRQSDRVLVVGTPREPPPWLREDPRLQGCDLLLYERDSGPHRLTQWVEALDPRAVYKLDDSGLSSGLECIARRLAGRSFGLVLSGGGARGLAHIGVLEGLEAAGVKIDRIAGCSMGAYIAGLHAVGLDTQAMRERCHEEFVKRNPLGDYTVPVVSLIRGLRARDMLTRSFGEETLIEGLPKEFFSVSCDLLTGELVVHRRGLLYEAVGMSMCLPALFAPIAREGRLLVDGGVLNNLPVEQMAAMGEGPVIASDVTARFAVPEGRETAPRRTRSRQWALRARRAVVGVDDPLPNLKETLTRAIAIGSVDAVERARLRADFLIAPATGEVGLLDFKQLDRMIEIGRTAVRGVLRSEPELTAG
jgi:NTE family protein